MFWGPLSTTSPLVKPAGYSPLLTAEAAGMPLFVPMTESSTLPIVYRYGVPFQASFSSTPSLQRTVAGQGLGTNGTSSGIGLGSVTLNNFTCLWIGIAQSNSGLQAPIFCFDNFPSTPRNCIILKSGSAAANNYEVSVAGNDFSNALLQDWTNIGALNVLHVVRNGDTATVYKNGVSQVSVSGLGTSVGNSFQNGYLGIHYYSGAPQEYGINYHLLFAIYGYPLTSAEIYEDVSRPFRLLIDTDWSDPPLGMPFVGALPVTYRPFVIRPSGRAR